jgi:hypothetical protein
VAAEANDQGFSIAVARGSAGDERWWRWGEASGLEFR